MRTGIILLLCLLHTACATNHPVMLGDSKVIVQQYSGKGNTYIHLHRNETTALKAAKHTIHEQGGSLITLVHKGGRNISFNLHNKRYTFDPNRIFSDTGIKKTLQLNSQYSPEAAREVKKLAVKIKTLLPPGKVIAVHNNEHYSLKDYLPGHNLAKEAQALYKNPRKYYRNFYLVTQLREYYRLKNAKLNTILQAKSIKDDGSLSIYLAKRNYINIEAGYDQLSEQIRMLRSV